MMRQTVDKKELVARTAQRLGQDPTAVETVVDALLDEIYRALKAEESVSLRNFGTFYLDVRRTGTVFKFNPAQRLRALFGWSSTYKGDL